MISPKAEIDPKAKIGKNVTVYPFAYIEGDVEIGDDCVIYPYVSVMNGTRMGRGNTVYQNTVLGAVPQDFNYRRRVTFDYRRRQHVPRECGHKPCHFL